MMRRKLQSFVLLWVAGCGARGETGEERFEPLPAPSVVAPSEPVAPVPRTPDPSALREIIGRAPRDGLGPTAGEGSLVGTETGVPERETASLLSPMPPTDHPRVQAGKAELQPALSSPAIERAARAQLYWPLRACRLPDGSAPPPESIVLGFTIRPDGRVDPASVSATAEDQALAEVALCALRAFSASPFLGPAAGLDTSSRVLITWPSVD